jgi:protein-S-isoprenylcysteine O-methyltransferase Ste14
MLMLIIGIGLLWAAHHHLGKSFHSLVVLKEKHALVKSGPYKWIRHPIYTAYLLNHIGGGLLFANLILTFIPAFFFGSMVLCASAKMRQYWLKSSAIITMII